MSAPAYWTKAERGEVKRQIDAEEIVGISWNEARRILATVDALEKALEGAQEGIHEEFCGGDEHLDRCQELVDLLAALEGKS